MRAGPALSLTSTVCLVRSVCCTFYQNAATTYSLYDEISEGQDSLPPPPLNYFLVPGSCILGRYWGQYRSKIHISWRAGPFQQLHDNSRPCEHAPRWYWCRSLPIRGCSGVVRTSKRHRRRILLLYRCSTGILLYVTETKKGTRRKRKNARFRIQIRIQNTDDLVLVLVHLASSVAERAKVLGTIIR